MARCKLLVVAPKKKLLIPSRRGRELFLAQFISPELKAVVRYWWRADVYPEYRQLWPGWWQCWSGKACGKAAVPDLYIERAVGAVKMLCNHGTDPAVLPRMAFLAECEIPQRTWPGDDPSIYGKCKKDGELARKGLAEARAYFEALPASPQPELYWRLEADRGRYIKELQEMELAIKEHTGSLRDSTFFEWPRDFRLVGVVAYVRIATNSSRPFPYERQILDIVQGSRAAHRLRPLDDATIKKRIQRWRDPEGTMPSPSLPLRRDFEDDIKKMTASGELKDGLLSDYPAL